MNQSKLHVEVGEWIAWHQNGYGAVCGLQACRITKTGRIIIQDERGVKWTVRPDGRFHGDGPDRATYAWKATDDQIELIRRNRNTLILKAVHWASFDLATTNSIIDIIKQVIEGPAVEPAAAEYQRKA